MRSKTRGPGFAILAVLLLLPGPVRADSDNPRDADTLAGMDAYVHGEWSAAVRSFRAALAADPEDEDRQERLEGALERAVAFWTAKVEEYEDRSRWDTAARAAAILASLAPDDPDVAGLVAEVKKKSPLPQAMASPPPACDAFPTRCMEGRLRAMESFGALGDRAEKLVDGGIAALLRMQAEGGFWDSDELGGYVLYDPGVTGLALSALLVDGPAGLVGDRGAAAKKAVDWLLRVQSDDGCFGPKNSNHFLYCHFAATEAFAQYAAVTGQEKRFRPVLEKARDLVLKSRNPDFGWRYGIRPGDNDTSVTFWAIAALHALRQAGIEVDDKPFAGAMSWLDAVTEDQWKRVGYNAKGTGCARPPEYLETFPSEESEALTSAGCLMRCYAGIRDADLDKKQLDLITGCRPNPERMDSYYCHLGARALVSRTGRVPKKWYAAVVEVAERHRSMDGSIQPVGVWGKDGGKVMTTAFIVLALAAPYAEPVPDSAAPKASDFFRLKKRTVRMPATATLWPTGLYVEPGMKIEYVPDGTAVSYPGLEPVGPEGHRRTPHGRDKVTSSSSYGSLIGQVGPDGRPFSMKRKGRLRIRERGHLYLRTNDEDPSRARGGFTVVFTTD